MDDLIKFEVVRPPKCLIIGKEIRYSDEALNNGDNRLPACWNECYLDNIFVPLKSQVEYIYNDSHAGGFTDWYLSDGDFSYIVGMLMKEGAAVPEGYCRA